MAELVALLAVFVVTGLSVTAILTWDERRLTPEQRARMWAPSTHLMAKGAVILGVPLLSIVALPIYFTKTRQSFWGFLLGIGFMIAVLIAIELAGVVVALAFGEAG